MKQVHASYSFVASTKTITLTGLNIDQDQLLLIVNATRGVQYFNFADSSLRATVTSGANTTVVLTDASTTGHANGDALVIYYDDQVTSQVVSGTVTANPGTGAFTVSGTVGLDNASLVALENITVTVGSSVALAAGSAQIGSVTASISNFPASQTVAGSVTVNNFPATQVVSVSNFPAASSVTIANFPSTQTVAGTVTVGNFPTTQTIAGTVTANVNFSAYLSGPDVPAPSQGIALGYLTDSQTFFAPVHEDQGLPVRIQGQSATQPISGTVTANVDPANSFGNGQGSGWRGVVQQGIMDHQENEGFTVRIAGTAEPALIGFVNINSCPTGGLITRFGSVVTANLSFITSAVTNTSRKYLLAQNISAGTVTIGIGFSPTTTQGIQLPAGGGLTFDAFCPTGAVYWLGAVTGAAYTILEG